ncbi:MAG: HNH endonuclease [Lachnospiraceae bacterium]|nr:HNH endonuclease [Lachnospiraceae bacterium]
MAGWDLKSGSITEYSLSEDRIWLLFNFVFSDSSRKRNTYKFGLIKSLLDSIFNGQKNEQGVYFSYEQLFARFAENYWNLIVKYDLRQMRRDGKSELSKVEIILKTVISKNKTLSLLGFEAIDDDTKKEVIKNVTAECRKCVVGALYDDFNGAIYAFNLKESGLMLNYCIYDFILKYKSELEKLNYYAWARFLEQVNDDNALVRVIDKLELATPRREDLSIYREILRREFEEDTCFYCGKKLHNKMHVDHFIPWSFVKDDKIWNFVLSCPTCNVKKNNRVPARDYLLKIEDRNRKIQLIDNIVIHKDFKSYSDDLLQRMWQYAKMSGIKEYSKCNGNL